MSTYPRDRQEFLNWCEAHFPVWQTNATAIGLSTNQITAFKGFVMAMRSKVTAQTTAKAAAKAATEAVVDAENDLRTSAADLVRSIRAFATNADNPDVYQLAQIPAPASGQPMPPPGQPTDFKVELNPNGSITLKWKAKHPQGSDNVVYLVQRKLPGETAFVLAGAVGEKAFTDQTLPVGIDGATYIITAQRGQTLGQPSRQLAVTFGSGGNQSLRVNFAEGEGKSKKAA